MLVFILHLRIPQSFSRTENIWEYESKRRCRILTNWYQNECSPWLFETRRKHEPEKTIKKQKVSSLWWVREANISIGILTSGTWTSFKNLAARFSRTIPSDAAKNARTWLIKCFSESDSFSQCCTSVERSTSSAAKPIHSKVKQPEFDDDDDDTTRNRAITHTHTHKTWTWLEFLHKN